MIVKPHIQGKQEQAAFAGLAETAEMAQQAEKINGILGIVSNAPKSQAQTEETPEEPQYTEYATLYAENSDFVGWLHIDNTNIDYPVMSTPEEPEYYLRRAFDKTSSQSGTPFVGADSTIDSGLFIVYGHMLWSSIFVTLVIENINKRLYYREIITVLGASWFANIPGDYKNKQKKISEKKNYNVAIIHSETNLYGLSAQ